MPDERVTTPYDLHVLDPIAQRMAALFTEFEINQLDERIAILVTLTCLAATHGKLTVHQVTAAIVEEFPLALEATGMNVDVARIKAGLETVH